MYARSFFEASLDAEDADDETYEPGEPLSDDENWDRHCESENVLFLADADDEWYDADSDDNCDSDESEAENDSSDDESDGEYVPNDRHSDDEPLEQQCVPEPDNTVSDADINFKISEELIQNWHTDLKDHVSAIVSGGMEYVRTAFSHVIPYGVKPDYQPLLSNTVETVDGSSRERVVESDSSAVNADGDDDDVDSNPSKRPRYEPSSTEADGGNDGDIDDDEDASQSRRGTKRPRERNRPGETAASSTPSASVKKAKHIKHHIFKGM